MEKWNEENIKTIVDRIYHENCLGTMLGMPAWANGLSVEADGFICKRYGK